MICSDYFVAQNFFKTLKDLLAVDRNKMAKFNLKMEKFN